MQSNPLKYLAILGLSLFLFTVSSVGTEVCDNEDYPIGSRYLWNRCLELRQCFIQCYNDERCAGFWFYPQTSSCRGHRVGNYLGRPTQNGRFYSLCRTRDCPKSRGYVKLKQSGQCVKVFQVVKTWNRSRDTCLADGGDLAVPNSKQKYRSLREYIFKLKFWKRDVGRRAWIGMRRHGDGEYQWVSDQSSWAAWTPGDPNYGQEECVQIFSKGMGDVRCHNPRYFICEINNTN